MNGAEASRDNALNKLRELVKYVKDRLVTAGFDLSSGVVPHISVLQELHTQQEPIRSRIMPELRDVVFNIASSSWLRVMWDKRIYECGPVVRGYPLPVALKIVQYVENNNRGLVISAMQQGRYDVSSLKPILLYWSTFTTSNGTPVTDMRVSHDLVVGGPEYKLLLKLWEDRKLLENRLPTVRKSVSSLFSVESGVPYEVVSGSIMSGFSPKGGATLPAQVVSGVFAANVPQVQTLPPPPEVTKGAKGGK